MRRIELRVTEAFFERVRLAAGDVPVARFVRRALEQALSGDPTVGAHLPKEPRGLTGESPARRAASARAPVPRNERDAEAIEALGSGDVPLPKIARRHWAS
jgi:hypothetical protein